MAGQNGEGDLPREIVLHLLAVERERVRAKDSVLKARLTMLRKERARRRAVEEALGEAHAVIARARLLYRRLPGQCYYCGCPISVRALTCRSHMSLAANDPMVSP